MSVITNFSIEGMTCGNCARHVKAALESLPGVTSATADHERATATVESQGELDRKTVRDALEEAGYALK